jgi:hypothetical protein
MRELLLMGVSTKEKTNIGVDGVLILEFSILLIVIQKKFMVFV